MEYYRLLERMVGIDSTFPNEGKLCSFLAGYLKGIGFDVKTQIVEGDRFNVLAQRGSGDRSVLFLGHIDTVPASSGWDADPHRIRKVGDKIYGLGCFDMKGGIAALIERLENSGPGKGKVKVLLCVDEENISKGAWKAVRGRRGWFEDVSLVVSPEPIDIKPGGEDANAVVLGAGGRVVIEARVRGRAAHQARYEEGIDAIKEMAKIVSNIGRVELREHGQLGKELIFVRKVCGESKGLSVPEDADFEIDMRLVPPSTAKDAVARVCSLVKRLKDEGIVNRGVKAEIKVKARETPYLEPFITDSRNKEVVKVLRILDRHLGAYAIKYTRSVSDENVMANALGVPVMRIGPKGSGAHAANEWVSDSSLKKLTKIYSEIIERN